MQGLPNLAGVFQQQFANWNGSFTSKQARKERKFPNTHTNQRLTQSIQVSTLPATKGIIKIVLRTSCLLSFTLLPLLLLSLLLFFALSILPSPIFLRGARFDQLQDVNERGADAKDPQIGCLVAWLLAGCTSHFLLSKFFVSCVLSPDLLLQGGSVIL